VVAGLRRLMLHDCTHPLEIYLHLIRGCPLNGIPVERRGMIAAPACTVLLEHLTCLSLGVQLIVTHLSGWLLHVSTHVAEMRRWIAHLRRIEHPCTAWWLKLPWSSGSNRLLKVTVRVLLLVVLLLLVRVSI